MLSIVLRRSDSAELNSPTARFADVIGWGRSVEIDSKPIGTGLSSNVSVSGADTSSASEKDASEWYGVEFSEGLSRLDIMKRKDDWENGGHLALNS